MNYQVSIHTSGPREKGEVLSVMVNGKSFPLLPQGGQKQNASVKARELQQTLDSLAEQYRIPFLMSIEGFGYPEIAKMLSLPLPTVKTRVFYARKKLRHLLAERYVSLR